MPEFKLNHYIPRVLLKNWVVSQEGRLGVHTYDALEARSYFSTASGRKAFSFAISPDIYVPKIRDKRYVVIEKWFSNLEDTFGKAVRILLSDENIPLFKKTEDIVNLLYALLSLRHRTLHVLESNNRFLKHNKKESNLLSMGSKKDQRILVLENIVNAIKHEAAEYYNVEFVVAKSNCDSYILCDMPVLNKVVDGFSFLPISSRVLLAFRPSVTESTYKRINGGNDLVAAINESLAGCARRWIIANNLEQIELFKTHVNTNPDSGSIFIKAKHLIMPFSIE